MTLSLSAPLPPRQLPGFGSVQEHQLILVTGHVLSVAGPEAGRRLVPQHPVPGHPWPPLVVPGRPWPPLVAPR